MDLFRFTLPAAVLIVLASCQPHAPNVANPKAAFFNEMKTLCGKTFAGIPVFPDDPEHDFYGAALLMTVAECSDTELRIPFRVNDDTSRTWILTLSDRGLLFKHDHRHDDGTPDEITNYGGWAHDAGSSTKQTFPADADTGALIPEAVTNEWYFEIDHANNRFIYNLERHGQPRFRAEFALTPVN